MIRVLLDGLHRKTRNAHLWLPSYVAGRWREKGRGWPAHAWVTLADHFEPYWGTADSRVAGERVARWVRALPDILARHSDTTGRSPRYGFFYPEEQYTPELLESLAALTRKHFADVEVHIHHDGGGEAEFVDRMGRFIERLWTRHGLLRRVEGRLRFGFIHGNWALDNSLPDGRWCGLNNELTLLKDLGCYADFTLPAAPSPAQAGPVNVIYRATDDPTRPRSHERGVPVRPGTPAVGDVTIVPGPLGLSWAGRPLFKPRLDTGEVAANHGSSPARVRLWLRVAPRIAGHAFIKLFAHGAQERSTSALLDHGGLDELCANLKEVCGANGTALHYVTPWEMWLAIERLRLREDPLGLLC